MAERSTRRFEGSLWLERLAWNAAATAVLAVLILLLLASLEWLDRVSGVEETATRATHAARTLHAGDGSVALGPPP